MRLVEEFPEIGWALTLLGLYLLAWFCFWVARYLKVRG